MYGRNGQSICLLSPFFCPSSKIAQPKYAKGASERARSASVYGTFFVIMILFLTVAAAVPVADQWNAAPSDWAAESAAPAMAQPAQQWGGASSQWQ